MGINIGASPLVNCSVGSTQVKSIHVGSTLVWAAVQLTNQTISGTNSGANAECVYEIDPDTFVYNDAVAGGRQQLEKWTYGAPTSYEARATLVSGTLDVTSGVGSWLGLGVLRNWGVVQAGVGNKNAVIDVEIRDATTLDVLATARINMTANRI